jgi:PAS domain-containing protein
MLEGAQQQFAELDLLYRSLPLALAVFDRDMRFLRVNDKVSKVVGIPAAAHIGLTLREVAPDFANAAEGYLRKVFQTGASVCNVELQGGTLREPDAVRNWLCSYYPLRAEDGTVSAAVAMSYSQDSENLAPATVQAHYLQKPYSPTTLGRVVREILDQAKKRKGAS